MFIVNRNCFIICIYWSFVIYNHSLLSIMLLKTGYVLNIIFHSLLWLLRIKDSFSFQNVFILPSIIINIILKNNRQILFYIQFLWRNGMSLWCFDLCCSPSIPNSTDSFLCLYLCQIHSLISKCPSTNILRLIVSVFLKQFMYLCFPFINTYIEHCFKCLYQMLLFFCHITYLWNSPSILLFYKIYWLFLFKMFFIHQMKSIYLDS